MGLDVAFDLTGVSGRMFDDVRAALILAAAEQEIVLGKIRMAEHVSGDQYVVRESVARGEIGMPGIAGENDLEQPRIAHMPL